MKGNFINSIYLSTTMGPSVKLQLSSVLWTENKKLLT
jgi:hypothetical protein